MTTDRWPLAYLYRTRIGSPASAVSFVWLEMAPLAAAVALRDIAAAAVFVVAHLGLLALYEIGYRVNDRASTATEHGGVRTLRSAGDAAWILPRMATFAAVAVAVALAGFRGPEAAWGFFGAGLAVLVLLLVHTAVGERLGEGRPARWIAFGWLAAGKYLPALLAVLPPGEAVVLAALGFAAYGAGRLVQYAVRKQGGTFGATALDCNASWLVCVAPLLIATAVVQPTLAPDVFAVVAVLAAHHVVAASLRLRAAFGTVHGERVR